MHRPTIFAVAGLLSLAGCSSDDTAIQPGAIGWACPGDNNCNPGLRCIGGFCAEDPNPNPDAGVDAGIVVDAGLEPDAGVDVDAGPEPDAGPVCEVQATLSDIQAKVFGAPGQPSCNQGNCHGAGASAGDIALDTPLSQLRQTLLGDSKPGSLQTKHIVPGEPDQSRLYVIMTNLNPGGAGGFMPPGGQPDACAVDALRQWILDGALEN